MSSSSIPKLSIIIPVFNEKNTVEKAIERIFDLPVSKDIIVVDDCSTDGSRELIQKLKNRIHFTFIKQEKNKGKGAAVIRGGAVAKGELIIVEDSDLELDPQDILRMLSLYEKGGYDLINGNRQVLSQKNSHFVSKLANIVTKLMLLIFYGKSIDDLLSSYKLCRLDKFRSLNLQSQRFGFETEWLIKALKNHWKISEVHINYYPRTVHSGKKITLKDGLLIMLNIIKYRFQK